ncbi:MAG: HYR domain-containing protein [Saprospiraceae bacterium]|nr:HYR domain-containing protein [Saprospiraceae bacterium]
MRPIFLLLFLAGLKTIYAAPHSSFLPDIAKAEAGIIHHSSFNTHHSSLYHSSLHHFIIDSLPTISCPPNMTLGTDPNLCSANHSYGVTANDDQPDWTLVQTAGLPPGSDFPIGITLNEFLVTDLDSNTAACTFTVTVKDYTAPVAVCHQGLTVTINDTDDLGDCYLPNSPNEFASVAWLDASVFDNGSFDQCSNTLLTIRRLTPYSNFIQTLNAVNGQPPCNDPFPDYPSEYERAISEQNAIKFYCAEAGTTQQLVLAVYQLDNNGNISVGLNGVPLYNQCFIEVTVEDKIKPVCTPPAQIMVSCEQFDPGMLSYGTPEKLDNCCMDTINVSANYSLFDTLCNRGTITRNFQAFDCSGNSSSCSQRVIVNYAQNYFIKFPDDTLVTTCNSTGVYGRPEFFGEDCELMGVSYEDEIFGFIWPDACFQIERNWTVINWCTYVPGLPLTYVPNPSLVSTQYHNPLNAPGPIVSACSTPIPWAPTLSKINPNDTLATNFCSFWSANANGYIFKQRIKIADLTAPTFVNCPPGVTTFLDPTENHPFYWNNVFNPILPAQNLAERQIDLSIEATDACYGGSVNIRYLLFLDLDGDGTMESVVNSMNPPPADTIFFNNLQAPNYIGGTPVSFDNRPVAQNQKWRFAIQENTVGTSRIANLRWNTAASPNTFVMPELPVGTHKIKWFAQDGCGSERECEHVFSVVPSPFVCIPPTDVVVSCEQFDPSLLSYGEPTFSGGCLVQDSDKSANYAQFDTICSKGTVVRTFNAVDDCGNLSQCSQRVVVNHLQDYFIKFPDDVIVTTDCNGTGIYGEPTFFGEDCELLAVTYEDQAWPGIPDACYKIERSWTVINWCTYNPLFNVTYVPNPNPNPITNNPANLPGPIVSTCGTPAPWASTVLKISPTDPIVTNFCTFWSANANGYQYKQLIKIIDNTPAIISNCPVPPTHFEDATQNDPELWQNVFNPDLPAQDLRETPVDLSVTVTDACSGNNVNIEYLLFLDLDANGQQETVVNSTSLGQNGLGWNNVQYNNFNTPNFAGGTPTTFDDRPVPTDQKWGFALQESVQGNHRTAAVRWNTQQSPNGFVLPELPNGRHKIKWFATDGCGNNHECERIFHIGDTTLVGVQSPENESFALHQNEPNPFSSSTTIRFHLPESTQATLSIFDADGRIRYRQTADYGQGMHTMTIEKDRLGSPGVLFYKLEAGVNMAWRKMVLLR